MILKSQSKWDQQMFAWEVKSSVNDPQKKQWPKNPWNKNSMLCYTNPPALYRHHLQAQLRRGYPLVYRLEISPFPVLMFHLPLVQLMILRIQSEAHYALMQPLDRHHRLHRSIQQSFQHERKQRHIQHLYYTVPAHFS